MKRKKWYIKNNNKEQNKKTESHKKKINFQLHQESASIILPILIIYIYINNI